MMNLMEACATLAGAMIITIVMMLTVGIILFALTSLPAFIAVPAIVSGIVVCFYSIQGIRNGK